jgi:hypothetical protein
MHFLEHVIPMKTPIPMPHMERFCQVQEPFLSSMDDPDPLLEDGFMTSVHINLAKYDKADNVDIIANQQRHLLPKQREQLKQVLRKYT